MRCREELGRRCKGRCSASGAEPVRLLPHLAHSVDMVSVTAIFREKVGPLFFIMKKNSNFAPDFREKDSRIVLYILKTAIFLREVLRIEIK